MKGKIQGTGDSPCPVASRHSQRTGATVTPWLLQLSPYLRGAWNGYGIIEVV